MWPQVSSWAPGGSGARRSLADDLVGWELELPDWWSSAAFWLERIDRTIVLATGHLAAAGRLAFAELAQKNDRLLCSVTHTLYVPADELTGLAELGCVFEIDAYTFSFDLAGRARNELSATLDGLGSAGALVYFTSDGGQESTGNPFDFGAQALDRVAALVGDTTASALGTSNPAAVVRWLDEGIRP